MYYRKYTPSRDPGVLLHLHSSYRYRLRRDTYRHRRYEYLTQAAAAGVELNLVALVIRRLEVTCEIDKMASWIILNRFP